MNISKIRFNALGVECERTALPSVSDMTGR